MVKVLRSFVRGPLEPYVGGFADGLLRQGYSRSSAEQHVCFVAHLDRWMQAAQVGVRGLSEPVIERYLAERRAAGYVEYRSLKAMRPLLDYLAPLGVLPVPAQVRPGAVEELLGRYRDYLLVERNLTAGTMRAYVDFVRPFVATRLRADVLDLAGMRAADVSGFVLATCPGRAVGSAKLIVCALRSLLRWLRLTGVIAMPLAAAVPSVAGWRLSSLPKALESDQLRELLGETRITMKTALDWARLPAGGPNWWAYRLAAVRGFAIYLHGLDPAHEVPAADLLPHRPRRASPFLYSDADIAALIRVTSTLRTPLRQATFATLIGLLAVTGIRVGEAIALDRGDLDPAAGRLLIRYGKFGKSRELVPHPSTVDALRRYQRLRDQLAPVTATSALFVSTAGTRLLYRNVHNAFHRLVRLAGLTPRSGSCRPRIHDIRHSCAVDLKEKP